MEKSGSMWNGKILAGKEWKNPGGLLGMEEPKLSDKYIMKIKKMLKIW